MRASPDDGAKPPPGAAPRLAGTAYARGMALVRIEFTIEPFVDGQPGAHVLAAWQAVEAQGCELDRGPFSSLVDVDEGAAHTVVSDLIEAALGHGATRVAVHVERPTA